MNYPFDLPAPVTHIEKMNRDFTKHHLANGQVVHQLTRADTGYPHDHPWPFVSTILAGGYEEEEYVIHPNGNYRVIQHTRQVGQTHSVQANTVHRIKRLLESECWTLVSPGRGEKTPGFYHFRATGIFRRDWNGRWKRFTPAN